MKTHTNRSTTKILSLVIVFVMAFSTTGFAKVITKEIKVHGDCQGCKVKIEDALDIKGITFAEWNLASKVLTLRYNDKTISYKEIKAIIAELGYKIEDDTALEKEGN